MNKRLFLSFSILAAAAVTVVSCEKDAKPSTTPPPPPVVSRSFVEEFDTVSNLSAKGWVIKNNTVPSGPIAWRQGKYELGGKLGNDVVGFPAFSAVYSQNEFISVDMNCASDAAAGTLSCWLITKPISVKNGDVFSFYTRTHGDYVDRMQVRANYTNASTNCGTGPEDIGDFKTLLVDINSSMGTDYPVSWTKYTFTVAGVTGLIDARFAFRYYVPDGGPSGNNGDMIGIDKFEFIAK